MPREGSGYTSTITPIRTPLRSKSSPSSPRRRWWSSTGSTRPTSTFSGIPPTPFWRLLASDPNGGGEGHRVIILLERACLHNRIGNKLMQSFPTRMCNVTAWRHSKLRAHWLWPYSCGGLSGIPRELQRLLSLIGYGSTGGVCGRSLTVGKILFTGRQTCSLYLVLWLCGQGGPNPSLSCTLRCTLMWALGLWVCDMLYYAK